MRFYKQRQGLIASLLAALTLAVVPAGAQKKPNILFIMGDDVGWFNIGAYQSRHDGG